MWQTLIHIPHEWNGIPIFGFGWALLLWAVLALVILTVASRASNFTHALKEWVPFLGFVALLVTFVLPAIELPAIGPNGTSVRDGIAIRGYGVMMGIAIVAAVALAAYRAERRGISLDIILGMATWLVVLGIGGGRLFYLVQYWDDFKQPDTMAMLGNALNLTQGGLVVYGAFLGGFVAFSYYVWRHKLSFLTIADVVVPSLMIGLALGRIGCFLNGCCYGGPTEQAWGVSFPPESVPYVEHLRTGRLHGFQLGTGQQGQVVVEKVHSGTAASNKGLEPGMHVLAVNGQRLDDQNLSERLRLPPDQSQNLSLAAQLLIERSPNEVKLETDRGSFAISSNPLPKRTVRIHPTQIYSAITAGLICLFLITVEPFLHGKGHLFAMWITVYPPARFLLELIRTDEGSFAGTGLTISQNVSLVISFLAVCFWVFLWTRKTDKLAKSA